MHACHMHLPGIKRVAILDFDVHHGNGTQAVVSNTQPSTKKVGLGDSWWMLVELVGPCKTYWHL